MSTRIDVKAQSFPGNLEIPGIREERVESVSFKQNDQFRHV